ncbi:hypothetical protein FI667_g11677, partial [Globisporangium splendens]
MATLSLFFWRVALKTSAHTIRESIKSYRSTYEFCHTLRESSPPQTMAASASKKRSATAFSRDEIGIEQLQSLKEKFADGDLNEKEFVSLFREITDSSLSETQLTKLYEAKD